jgi:plastocyanin
MMVLALLPAARVAPAAAQTSASSVLERSPNMVGGWPGDPGTIHFNFLHRFTESGPPQHQISNSPTFVVAAGLPWRSTAGFAYATSSDVAPGMPNEWEFFGRVVPLAHGNRFADVSLQLGYNHGPESVDGELALARRVGPVRVLAAGRSFSNAYDGGRRRSALAGGASVRLTRHVAVAGDAGTLLERRAGERVAWSAGLQLGIPNAPHSFSIQATNTNTATLEGVSRGTARTRYGFEYTVPITLARYFPALRRRPPDTPVAARAAQAAAATAATAGDTVRAGMQQLSYTPAEIEVKVGTTVVWTNDAPLAHTVTADDSSFDSGLIDAGRRWSYTFTRAGRFPFHCTPHPFMKGVVVVR